MNAAEAEVALANGAEIIDGKDPHRGALGALDLNEIAAIVTAVAGRAPVSATIGDDHGAGAGLLEAVRATAAAGAGIVKIGFYGTKEDTAAAQGLANARLDGARMFAVLMADRISDFSLLGDLAKAGFIGAMLDTFDKSRGSVTGILNRARLAEFVAEARRHGLVAGLAGSLRISDIAALSALEPDILGFRGALCAFDRTGAIEAARVTAVRHSLDEVRNTAANDWRARATA